MEVKVNEISTSENEVEVIMSYDEIKPDIDSKSVIRRLTSACATSVTTS